MRVCVRARARVFTSKALYANVHSRAAEAFGVEGGFTAQVLFLLLTCVVWSTFCTEMGILFILLCGYYSISLVS